MQSENKRFTVKRTNSGLGLFTVAPIPTGKRIIEYIGVILTKDEADQKGGKYLMKLDDEYFIDGSPRTNIARYINHSCQPNAKAFRTGVRIWIWSIRDIEAREQITYDYGKKYFEDFIRPVGCGCEKCRKTLKTD